MPASEAFDSLYSLTWPESRAEEEYPEGIDLYRAETENIAESGASVFAVSDGLMVSVLAAKTQRLVPTEQGARYEWVAERKLTVTEACLPQAN